MIGYAEMESTLHYTSVTHADAMMTSINKMRLNSDLCDVTVIVGNFRIMAHRVILSASAPFFYQTLQTSAHHQQTLSAALHPTSELHLDGVDVTAALKIIEFCYTSAISLDNDNVWPLLTAALKFELTEISGLCCEFVSDDLDISNCLHVQCMAARLNCSQLVATAAQFIEENIEKICASSSLLSLAAPDVVDLTSSLSASRQKDDILLSVITAWLGFDPAGRCHVSQLFLRKFPEFREELSNLYPGGVEDIVCGGRNKDLHGSSGTTDGLEKASTEVPTVGVVNSPETLVEKSDPTSRGRDREGNVKAKLSVDSYKVPASLNHSEVSVDEPLYICVSCGDEFASASELCLHQRCCEESAHPVYVSRNVREWRERRGQAGAGAASSSQNNASPLEDECGITVDDSLVCSPSERASSSDFKAEQEVGGGVSSDMQNYLGTGSQLDNARVSADAADFSGGCDTGSCGDEEASGAVLGGDKHEGNATTASSSREAEVDDGMLHNDTNNNDINEGTGEKNGDGAKCEEENVDGVNVESREMTGSIVGIDSGGEGKAVVKVEPAQPDELSSSTTRLLNLGSELSTLGSQSMLGFKCQICYKGFGDRKSLSKHWKMTHGVDQRAASGMGDHSTVYQSPTVTPATGASHEQREKVGGAKKSKLSRASLVEADVGTEFSSSFTSSITQQQQILPADVNGSSEASELYQQYVRQYQEFAKWCMEQSPTFCQACLLYHPKGSVCPKAAEVGGSGTSEQPHGRHHRGGRQTTTTAEVGQGFEGARTPDGGCHGDKAGVKTDPSAESEQPLDMSKSSHDFSPSSAATGGIGGSTFLSPLSVGRSTTAALAGLAASSPLGLSQYYNYARLLAGDTSVSHQGDPASAQLASLDVNGDAAHAIYGQFLPYPPSSSSSSSSTGYHHALSLVQDNSSLTSVETNRANNSADKFPSLPDQKTVSDGPKRRQNSKGGEHPQTSSGQQRSGPKRRLASRQGFPCNVCTRVFSYQAALFTHMRTHSPTARVYQCQLCHESFARAPDLKVHVCPNGIEKPYNCPSCGQTFAKNIHLKRHLATHSGLKPYPCWVCGKRFSRSDHLKRHTQSIHAGSRPHVCQVCGKEFVRKYELNKHMLMHSAPGMAGGIPGLTAGVSAEVTAGVMARVTGSDTT
ncbi:uncharacterized protein LOC101849073 [Aplysia californica]|uniref:Uncharacterized protein LOC101849073 n=1 Tax=Aplysia californica TaxID=6500 RepID=A0ABM0JXU5_APLCA|nr:uncharacterized protein LOC101849073 [Aplysia californica]